MQRLPMGLMSWGLAVTFCLATIAQAQVGLPRGRTGAGTGQPGDTGLPPGAYPPTPAGNAAQMAAATGRYQPARPTLSPYLNLFREETGPIPNYHLYVRPQLQQQAFNNQFQSNLNQTQQQLQQVPRTANRPTGVGSGYRNFLHYYQGIR